MVKHAAHFNDVMRCEYSLSRKRTIEVVLFFALARFPLTQAECGMTADDIIVSCVSHMW